MWMEKKSQPPQLHLKAWIEPALPPFLCSYLPNGHILASFSIFDYPDKTQQSKVSQTLHSHESASCHRGTCLGSAHPFCLISPKWKRHRRMTANRMANHYPEVAALEMGFGFPPSRGIAPRAVESKAGLTEKVCLPYPKHSKPLPGDLGGPFRA